MPVDRLLIVSVRSYLTSHGESMEVGQQLVDRLIDHGVKRVFGLPGGQTASFYNGLARRRDVIEHVLMRDERSGAFAADAYARITGSLGVCDATVGPGATNLVSGLVESLAASVPLLAIVPDVPRGWEHRRRRSSASQSIEQRDILTPCVKWFARVNDVDHFEAIVDQCIRVATSGRPGPVVLEIPHDIMRAEVPPSANGVPRSAVVPRNRSAPDPADVMAAADAIAASVRPVLLVGGGAHISGAYAEVVALAERHSLPVITTTTGKGVISEYHTLSLGVCGGLGSHHANAVFENADCVIVAGAKLNQITTLNFTVPNPGATVIHIELDGEEIGRNFPRTLPLESDCRLGLRALQDALDGRFVEHEWDLSVLQKGIEDFWAGESFKTPREGDKIKPQDAMRVLGGLMSDDDVLVADASLQSGWGSSRWRVDKSGRRYLAPRGVGGLGWGLPAAVGAAFGLRDLGSLGRVVCIAGDGGWGYSMTELEVLARFEVPVVTMLLNNDVLAWNKHVVTGTYPGEDYVSQEYSPVDWAAAAAALGANGLRVTELDQLAGALQAGLDERSRPSVIEVLSSEDETPWIGRREVIGSAQAAY
jgi:acetolactate synthase-1/2/3 large subunit